ncbi:MAG: hypothetical protein ACI9SP_003783 [Arenicella sp.]|jgi:hypothetical protein
MLIRRPAVLVFISHPPVILTKMPNSMPKRLIANKFAVLQKTLRSLMCLTLALSLSACASYYGAAKIVSSPSGAQVISADDGSVIGTTPMTYRWKNGNGNRKTIIVKLKKAGYYEKTSSFWLNMRARNLKAALAAANSVEIEMQKIGE